MKGLRPATNLFALAFALVGVFGGAAYARAATYANLLTNPGAETGDFSGWTINHASTNCGSGDGQTGWCVHLTSHTGTYGFQSTYPGAVPMASMYQVVDLVAAGYAPAVLDAAPAISVSTFVTAVNENGSSPNDQYRFIATLQDAAHATVATYDTGTTTLAATTGWVALSNTFTGYGSGVRYVYIEQDGKNGGTWGGGYGAVFDDASTTVAAPAPTISLVAATSTPSGTTVSWTTDDAGSSLVRFGPTSSLGSSTAEFDSVSRVRSHAVTLSGLSPCSLYYYQVQSADVSALVSTSSVSSVRTMCTGGATVTAAVQADISTSTGGTVSQGSLNVSVPPAFSAAASTTVTFEVSALSPRTFSATAGKPSSGLNMSAGPVYTLKALNGDSSVISSFDAPITLTFSYSADDIVGLQPSTLTIYRYDGGVWTALSNCSVDTVGHTVSCQTSHFSDFAIFGTPVQTASAGSSGGTIGTADLAKLLAPGPAASAYLASRGYVAPSPASVPVAAAVPVVSSAQSAAVPTFTRDLRVGTSGADVLMLQKYLNSRGFVIAAFGPGSVGSETNMFGSLTRSAVIRLQRSLGLPATGFFGPLTRGAIQK